MLRRRFKDTYNFHFMILFQVSTHPDIDLSVLPHTGLSEEFELLNVDFETAIDEEVCVLR